jgi:TP901 family phage tail tape measure protein
MERRVKVIYSAEIQNYKSAMEAAAAATEKIKKASEEAGKASDAAGKAAEESNGKSAESAKLAAEEIAKLAAAHQEAAKAVDLQYSGTGQLVDMNGKALNSQQAAAVGLEAFSKEAYLAGRAAEEAGAASELAAKASEDAAKAAAEAEAKHKDAVEEVATAAGVSAAVVVAGVGVSINAYAEFDKQMSVVDSATHETADNMNLLRQAAIDAGADTSFSATEAAQGIEEMAKAGVATSDILSGGLNGTLALAAAGALGVGDASEIAASAMTQFGLVGKDIPHIADLLAAGAGKAQGSVQDLGLALSYAGVPAHGMGVSIEQTTGTLALFAKAGIVGEKAGTALRAMLVSMVKPSEQTKTAMDDLGITFSDSKGKFIGLDGAAGVLQDRLGGLDDMTRNATLAQIFGNEALGAAQTLYSGGAQGVKDMTAAVDDYGYATDTARRMQNNLQGDLEKLGGSFDTVLIQGGHGANDVLRGMVQGMESLVDTVGMIPGPVLSVGVGLAGIAGGAVVLGSGLVALNVKIATTRAALALLAPVGTRAGTALAVAGKMAAGAASGLVAIAVASTAAKPALDNILKPTGETADALKEFAGQASLGAFGADTLSKSFQDLVQHKDGVNDFQQAINGIVNPGIWGNIDNVLVTIGNIGTLGMANLKSTSETARDRFKEMGAQLASLDASKAIAAFQSMAKQTDGSQESLKRLLDYMPDYRKKLEEQAKASGLATDDQTLLNIALGKIPTDTKGADGQAKAIGGVGQAAEDAKPSAEDLAKALEEVGVRADGSVGDLDKFTEAIFRATHTNLSARDAARGFEEAIDKVGESIIANGTTLDINTEKGRANQAALDGLAGAGIAVVEANAKNGASQETLQGNLSTTYDKLIAGAGQFGITGQAAIDLARDVLKVPPGVDIKSWMSDEAKRMAEATKKAAEDVDGKQVNIYVNTHETTFQKVLRAFENADPDKPVGTGTVLKSTGGILRGYSDGGQLPSTGPGTGVTDGFLGVDALGVPVARVDADEWIINGYSSNRYNRELAAINAGTFPKLPGYAGGARAGREYSAQSLGYAPAGASNMTVSAPAVTVMIGNEQLDSRMYRVAGAAISSADSQSQFARKGR